MNTNNVLPHTHKA